MPKSPILNCALCTVLALFISRPCHSQVINGYAKVTAVAGTTLTLSNVNEAADSFEDDEWVVLIQIQDNVIGTTTNTADFGSLGSISSAGRHEIRQIDSHTEVAGTPSTITLKNIPNYTYNTGANSTVQIVTFREFGSPDYTTTANMSALPWDGNIGGVIAFNVPGTLTLAHNIDANGSGFTGGGFNGGASTGCTGSSNYRVATTANHADKGEGIYNATDLNYAAGRARILNGGGGGNSHNAGGGGGGNYSGGGTGGPGWPTCSPTAGGIGGLDMSGEITIGRIFMGGGGGAGEGNNGFATPGANGGGIILIRATEITTTSCAGLTISANAASVLGTSGNDGAGGGGGGGSIIFEVETWSISASCTLSISANGGDGGSVNSGATHGGGGGGGQGVVFFSTSEPTTNVSTETLNGDGGCNNSADPCLSQAGSGTGVDNAGILDIFTEPLPIELINFEGHVNGENVLLEWTTKSERNNAYFTIERSIDGENWLMVSDVPGAGNSTETLNYNLIDYSPYGGLSYYRLTQTDFDGTTSVAGTISIQFDEPGVVIYPNPANQAIQISGEHINASTVALFNPLGQMLETSTTENGASEIVVNLQNYPPGTYLLTFERNGKQESHRITIIR